VTAAGIAFNSSARDPRIGAAIVLSGGAFAFPGEWFTDDAQPALLLVHGTADEVNPISSSVSLYEQARGPKWLVTVGGGARGGPFTPDAVVAAVAALTAAFLAPTLPHDAAAAAHLPIAATSGALQLVAAG